jgi:NADH-quinone oxidoreductase subunit J
MNLLFYIAAVVALLSTFMVITGKNAVHALLYLIVSLLAVSLVFLCLGAPFAAALEVIIYAGAIMVLFVFVIMMLNIGPEAAARESEWLKPSTWLGPSLFVLVLAAEFMVMLVWSPAAPPGAVPVGPKQVGIILFGPYLVGVELASLLLLAGLIGAYHLGRSHKH